MKKNSSGKEKRGVKNLENQDESVQNAKVKTSARNLKTDADLTSFGWHKVDESSKVLFQTTHTVGGFTLCVNI